MPPKQETTQQLLFRSISPKKKKLINNVFAGILNRRPNVLVGG